MKRRRPILCGVDRSVIALRAADVGATVSCMFDAPLVLAHAVAPRVVGAGWGPLGGKAVDLVGDAEEREQRIGQEVLRRAASRLRLNPEIETQVVVGAPGDVLGDAAGALDAAAIVVGVGRRRRLLRAIARSVPARLAARAPCPVVVVGPEIDARALAKGPILSAFDGSVEAERAAIVAAVTADRLARELVLVHVLPRRVRRPRRRIRRHGELADHGKDIAGEESWARLSALAAIVGIDARLVVAPPEGSMPRALLRVAHREGAACLVIAAHPRGGLPSMLGDSVATAAAARSRCPVVVVPPAMRAPDPPRPHPARRWTNTPDAAWHPATDRGRRPRPGVNGRDGAGRACRRQPCDPRSVRRR